MAYHGPLRDEPLSIELHNTIYATRSGVVDGLSDEANLRAWTTALADRLPRAARPVDPARLAEFHALRQAIRDAFEAVLAGRPPRRRTIQRLNMASSRAPWFSVIAGTRDPLTRERRYANDDPTDVALAAIADDAIALVGGPDRGRLRACGAPRCVLVFLKDHPRRTWCSTGCGNRARQAQFQARRRGEEPRPAARG